MNTAIEIAQYIIKKSLDDNNPITNLKLQKMLYYIQKDSLRQRGTVAFHDIIQAWPFGPVVPTVYYKYCGYGAMPITAPVVNDFHFDSGIKQIIENVIEKKININPWEMVEDTHKTGGAWQSVYNNGSGYKKEIPLAMIEKEVQLG